MLGEVNSNEGSFAKLFYHFQLPNVVILGKVNWNEGRQSSLLPSQFISLFSALKQPNARGGELE